MFDEEEDDNSMAIALPEMWIPPVELLPMLFHVGWQQIVNQPNKWHPDCVSASSSSYGPTCLKSVSKDLRELLASRPPGADVFPNDEDATRLELLVRGQPTTPYDGGFFHFSLRVPPEYPQLPPRAVLRTTDHGRVRFNPNYYENGCACLSILGTYPGEPWNPSYTLSNVLHSLQFQLNQMPWDNEPAFDQNQIVQWKQLYNNYLAHETLRVAVCNQIDPSTSQLPLNMRRRAARHFVNNYEAYLARCSALAGELDGKPMMEPYGKMARNVPFQFGCLRQRLESLRDSAQRDADADVDEDDDDMTVDADHRAE